MQKRRMADAQTAADYAGVALPTWWKAVAAGRMPAPYYPAPRAPRWDLAEIDAALAATRALPAEAKEARRRVALGLTGTGKAA